MPRAAARSEPAERRLTSFYAEMSSLEFILGMVSQLGVDMDRLAAKDLYTRGVDCQNLGGFAVLEAIARAVDELGGPEPVERVLDVGCGVGGPGRFVAERFAASVVGIDLLAKRVEIARALTEKVGLADRVTYRLASATALPFRRREFGHVWMLDASIHVRDKTTLFRELARVLAPGGLLVLHDMPGPLPSAMRAVTSRAPYYAPPLSQLIRHVERAGLRPLAWRDTAPLVRADFEAKSAAVAKASAATPQQAPPEARRRLAQGRAALRGYLAALDTKGPGCGFLIARR